MVPLRQLVAPLSLVVVELAVQLVGRRRVRRVRHLERLAHLDGPRLVRVLPLLPLALGAAALPAADGVALPAGAGLVGGLAGRPELGRDRGDGLVEDLEERSEGRDAGADLSNVS
jgi:hypothetical protein